MTISPGQSPLSQLKSPVIGRCVKLSWWTSARGKFSSNRSPWVSKADPCTTSKGSVQCVKSKGVKRTIVLFEIRGIGISQYYRTPPVRHLFGSRIIARKLEAAVSKSCLIKVGQVFVTVMGWVSLARINSVNSGISLGGLQRLLPKYLRTRWRGSAGLQGKSGLLIGEKDIGELAWTMGWCNSGAVWVRVETFIWVSGLPGSISDSMALWEGWGAGVRSQSTLWIGANFYFEKRTPGLRIYLAACPGRSFSSYVSGKVNFPNQMFSLQWELTSPAELAY